MEELLGKWLATRPKIWQMELLSPVQLATFCRERSLVFDADQITRLWQIGVLHADLVLSKQRLRRVGLVRVGRVDAERDEQEAYADARPIPYLAEGSRRFQR